MSIACRGQTDRSIDRVLDALRPYEMQHRKAKIEVYRQNSVSIRVRIIDPDFSGISRADRHETVWRFFEDLTEDVQSQISLLLLLTPKEVKQSFANMEFEHPTRSNL